MDKLIIALGPAFAAGFAVQQLLEILDPLLSRLTQPENKKVFLGFISLMVGILLSAVLGLRVLQALGVAPGGVVDVFDIVITGLIISAGTEGFNSILKFMGYAKDNKKKG